VVSVSHTTTHHSRWASSGRVISQLQRPLPNNTQHSQQTDIHVPGGIPTQYLSSRAAVYLRLRPHGHWDRQGLIFLTRNSYYLNFYDVTLYTSYYFIVYSSLNDYSSISHHMGDTGCLNVNFKSVCSHFIDIFITTSKTPTI
jgi:hypothetical protein